MIEGVVVAPLLVRDAAERQPRQIAERVVAPVDVEAERSPVLDVGDGAERVLGAAQSRRLTRMTPRR